MYPVSTYHIKWADNTASTVVLSEHALGYAQVAVTGHRGRLDSLADYKSVPAIEMELVMIARKHAAQLVKVDGGN